MLFNGAKHGLHGIEIALLDRSAPLAMVTAASIL